MTWVANYTPSFCHTNARTIVVTNVESSVRIELTIHSLRVCQRSLRKHSYSWNYTVQEIKCSSFVCLLIAAWDKKKNNWNLFLRHKIHYSLCLFEAMRVITIEVVRLFAFLFNPPNSFWPFEEGGTVNQGKKG